LGYRTNQDAQKSELKLAQRTEHPINLIAFVWEQFFHAIVPVHVNSVTEEKQSLALSLQFQQRFFLYVRNLAKHFVGSIYNLLVGNVQPRHASDFIAEFAGADEPKSKLVHELTALWMELCIKIFCKPQPGKGIEIAFHVKMYEDVAQVKNNVIVIYHSVWYTFIFD
jgi:hypothetical protein